MIRPVSIEFDQSGFTWQVKPYPNPSLLSRAFFQYVAVLIGHGFSENKVNPGNCQMIWDPSSSIVIGQRLIRP
jgi:hypothetical protein